MIERFRRHSLSVLAAVTVAAFLALVLALLFLAESIARLLDSRGGQV